MQAGEMLVAPDHTDQVRRVHRLLTGPLRPTNLVLPQRRLVCYCRLYEVPHFFFPLPFESELHKSCCEHFPQFGAR